MGPHSFVCTEIHCGVRISSCTCVPIHCDLSLFRNISCLPCLITATYIQEVFAVLIIFPPPCGDPEQSMVRLEAMGRERACRNLTLAEPCMSLFVLMWPSDSLTLWPICFILPSIPLPAAAWQGPSLSPSLHSLIFFSCWLALHSAEPRTCGLMPLTPSSVHLTVLSLPLFIYYTHFI